MSKRPNQQFMVHNNVKLTSHEEDRCRYAFVDSAEHHADRILMGSLIPTKFEHDGPQRSHDGFEVRICSFNSRYESWFLCCMSDLEWVLQVQGNYIQACERLLGASIVIRSELRTLTRQNKRRKPFEPTVDMRLLGAAANE